MNPVEFNRGHGRLTSNVLNDTGYATHKVWNPAGTFKGPKWMGPFMCEVKGSTGMYGTDNEGNTGITQGGRFLYNLDEVFFENYLGLGVTTNNRLSTEDRFLGINIAEIGNTGEDGADDRVRSGLTAGQLEFFELLPTPDGAVVETWWSRCSGVSGATGSDIIYVFNRAGEFYGPC